MTKPLALVVYENLMPGSQLVNHLQDLGYRVQTLANSANLIPQAEQERPLVVIVDLAVRPAELCLAITELQQNPATGHIPVLAFTDRQKNEVQASARDAGAKVVASDVAVMSHLPDLLERVLQVD